MDYMSTDFGADSAVRFPFRVQTDRQMRLNTLPMPVAIQPVWVMIGWGELL